MQLHREQLLASLKQFSASVHRHRARDTAFFPAGQNVSGIARVRGFKDSTICSHLEETMLAGEVIEVNALHAKSNSLFPRANFIFFRWI